jgi:hypothetical protein
VATGIKIKELQGKGAAQREVLGCHCGPNTVHLPDCFQVYSSPGNENLDNQMENFVFFTLKVVILSI